MCLAIDPTIACYVHVPLGEQSRTWAREYMQGGMPCASLPPRPSSAEYIRDDRGQRLLRAERDDRSTRTYGAVGRFHKLNVLEKWRLSRTRQSATSNLRQPDQPPRSL